MHLFLRTFIIESVEAYQRSFDRGMQMGHQRRNKASHIAAVIFLVLLFKSLQIALQFNGRVVLLRTNCSIHFLQFKVGSTEVWFVLNCRTCWHG